MPATISLTSFIDFTAATGSPRRRVPARLRALYEDPRRHPWDYYGELKEAVVQGFTGNDLSQRLSAVVAEAITREDSGDPWLRGLGRHYASLAEGALELRRRSGPVTTLDAPHGEWVHQELRVRANPPLAVRRGDGRQEAWYFYLKEAALKQAGADAALLILSEVLSADGAGLIPRVVNLRNGDSFTLHRNRNLADLRRYVVTEAEAFLRLWEVSAAA